MKLNVIDKSETINLEIHWACGRINCDCDEQTDALLDEQMREEDEPAFLADCY